MSKSSKALVSAVLTKARNVLEASYIKWQTDDGHGGHCAVGAIRIACKNKFADWQLERCIDEIARERYPKLIGKRRRRPDGFLSDIFNHRPTVYVNNHLGKKSILALFDTAIARAKEIEARP